MQRPICAALGLLTLTACTQNDAPTTALVCAAETMTRTADPEDEVVVVRRGVTAQAVSYYAYADGQTFLCTVDRDGRVGVMPI